MFYVGLLKPYRDPALVSAEALAPQTRRVVAALPGQAKAESLEKRLAGTAAVAAPKGPTDRVAR